MLDFYQFQGAYLEKAQLVTKLTATNRIKIVIGKKDLLEVKYQMFYWFKS